MFKIENGRLEVQPVVVEEMVNRLTSKKYGENYKSMFFDLLYDIQPALPPGLV